MIYLPILQELFTSDSIIMLLIGGILALWIGIKRNDIRRNAIGLGCSFCLYVVCEVGSNVRTNYMIELMLLFVGTIAIGGVIGFFISSNMEEVFIWDNLDTITFAWGLNTSDKASMPRQAQGLAMITEDFPERVPFPVPCVLAAGWQCYAVPYMLHCRRTALFQIPWRGCLFHSPSRKS